jgi:hypothetical protein
MWIWFVPLIQHLSNPLLLVVVERLAGGID